MLFEGGLFKKRIHFDLVRPQMTSDQHKSLPKHSSHQDNSTGTKNRQIGAVHSLVRTNKEFSGKFFIYIPVYIDIRETRLQCDQIGHFLISLISVGCNFCTRWALFG